MWKVSREMNRDSSVLYAKCNMRTNFADATRRFRLENNSSRKRKRERASETDRLEFCARLDSVCARLKALERVFVIADFRIPSRSVL